MITHFDIDIYAYRVHVLHNVTDAQFTKYFADTFKCSEWSLITKQTMKHSVI